MSIYQGKRIVCATTGKVHKAYRRTRLFEFVDYSWPCKGCGGRHCSECAYVQEGDTITVYDCGRFGWPR